MKSGMMRWKTQFLYPTGCPFCAGTQQSRCETQDASAEPTTAFQWGPTLRCSPVQNCRKFSAVRGQMSFHSSILMRPAGTSPIVTSKKTTGLSGFTARGGRGPARPHPEAHGANWQETQAYVAFVCSYVSPPGLVCHSMSPSQQTSALSRPHQRRRRCRPCSPYHRTKGNPMLLVRSKVAARAARIRDAPPTEAMGARHGLERTERALSEGPRADGVTVVAELQCHPSTPCGPVPSTPRLPSQCPMPGGATCCQAAGWLCDRHKQEQPLSIVSS